MIILADSIDFCIDTPGFENENKTKPEETKLISGTAGLASPEDTAKQILRDTLVISSDFYFFVHVLRDQSHEIFDFSQL